jgi:hypothetical protein
VFDSTCSSDPAGSGPIMSSDFTTNLCYTSYGSPGFVMTIANSLVTNAAGMK